MLAESLAEWVSRARGSAKSEKFWALQEVSCEVAHGEILGLVGRNGAGKSTLLKIIAGVTTPTTGEVDVYGRIGSMLEVGTGFHPELTGRENVFLNGAFVGMRRSEIRARFDEIVEFSGVESFLDVPIKRYSSGMAVRLAFSVAAHLDADILLVDEVLAVGDQAFQDKCLGKIRDVRLREGRTVLFVSHNLAAVASLCTRALLLSAGRVIADASASEITRLYSAGVAMATTTDEVDLTPLPRNKRTAAQCTAIQVSAVDELGVPLDAIMPGATVQVTVTVTATEPVSRAFLAVEIMDERGRPAVGISTDMADGWLSLNAGQSKRVAVRLLDVQVRPGIYTVGLILTTVSERLDGLDAVVRFEVMPSPDAGYDRWPGWIAAAYAPKFDVEIG
jgi:lipopolysaccharide transport system ATP-binding protein